MALLKRKKPLLKQLGLRFENDSIFETKVYPKITKKLTKKIRLTFLGMSGNPNNEGSPPSLVNSLHSHHSNGYNSISFTTTTFTDNYSRNDNENMQDDFGSIAAPPNIQLSQEPQMNNEMHNTGDMEMNGFQLSPTASFFPTDQVYDFMETENGPLPGATNCIY